MKSAIDQPACNDIRRWRINFKISELVIGEMTGIQTHISFLRKGQNRSKVETNLTLFDSTCLIFSGQFWNAFHQHYLASLSKDYRWVQNWCFKSLCQGHFQTFSPLYFLFPLWTNSCDTHNWMSFPMCVTVSQPPERYTWKLLNEPNLFSYKINK